MRRCAVLFGLVVCMCGPVSAIDLSVFGSHQDFADADYGKGLGVRSVFGGENLGFSLGLSYYGSEVSVGTGECCSSCGDANLQVMPLDLGMRWTISGKGTWRPYVEAGVNVLFAESSGISVDDQVGWYALGGFQVGDGQGVDFMLDVMYRSSDGDFSFVEQGFTIQAPDTIDLSGIGFSIGAVWIF